MSASEGKQNNQMSAKDIEAEEMAQELMSMEMYEEGMEYDQMKQILQVINESRDMARIEPDIRPPPEVVPYLSEIAMPEVSTMNNITHESNSKLSSKLNLRPKLSFSYRSQIEKDLPVGPSPKSPLSIAPSDEMSVSSPELLTPPDKSVVKRSAIESELLFNALNNENEQDERETSEGTSQAPIKNAWHNITSSLQNSQSSQSTEISVNIESTKSRKNQKLEMWKLDPTQAVVADNDVPLQEKSRPFLRERMPYSFCHQKRALEASEKIIAVLTYRMEEVAEIWRRKHKPHDSEFQWGAPIKVGSNNGSLDRKPIIEDSETPVKQQSFGRSQDTPSTWKGQDRQCKRKAVENIKDLINGPLDSDEDSDDIFEKTKKPKTIDKHWLSEDNLKGSSSSEKHLTRDEIFGNFNSTKPAKPALITDYDSDESDNHTLLSLCAKNKKKDEADNGDASPEPFIRRRIVPPNPAKPKLNIRPRNNGEKIKRKSPVRRNAQAGPNSGKDSEVNTKTRGKAKIPLFKRGKNQEALDINEIADELEKIDAAENREEIEIKPMPIKGYANRFAYSAAMLLQSKKTEEEAQNAKTREQIRLQEEEKMKKEKLVNARLRKEEEERRHKEAKEREVKAKEEKWKNTEAIRDRNRRNRQLQEKKLAEEVAKNQMFMNIDNNADDDDDNLIITRADIEHRKREERTECPICHLEFSQEDIENHAANCDQFDNDDEPTGSCQPTKDDDLIVSDNHRTLICNVCSRFSTTNGTIYEEHVHKCLRKGNSHTQLDPTTVVIEVPTSPVRCYVPISEQTESAINYKEQHPKQLAKPQSLGIRRPR